MKYKKIPNCKFCGQHFDNVFDATDHLLEDSGEEPFDPKLILPNGYQLMIGSLLRCLYNYADRPEDIKEITQSTYATLYAAETNPGKMKRFIEDMIIHEHMASIDEDLIDLLKKENKYKGDGDDIK